MPHSWPHYVLPRIAAGVRSDSGRSLLRLDGSRRAGALNYNAD
jgi:hypothetical protein